MVSMRQSLAVTVARRSPSEDRMTQIPHIEGALIHTSLQKILDSATFSRSERLRSFLRYVVTKEQEGLGHQLKGYTIGIDVFERGDSFDPGGDPLVRVQAGKLRKLLAQYYAEEGSQDPLTIIVPVGAYVPSYELRRAPVAIAPMPAEIVVPMPAARTRRSWMRFAPIGLLSVTILNITALGLHATSRYLAPNQPLAINRAGSLDRQISALPRITVDTRLARSDIAAPLAEAMRVSARQLLSVEFKDVPKPGELAGPQPGTLDFTLAIRAGSVPGKIVLDLRHSLSGDLIYSQTYAEQDLQAQGDRLFAASAFVDSTMPIGERLYRFAAGNDHASSLMQCLNATHDYKRDRSRENFASAVNCQRALIPHGDPARFITDLDLLQSQVRSAEAARLARDDA